MTLNPKSLLSDIVLRTDSDYMMDVEYTLNIEKNPLITQKCIKRPQKRKKNISS